MRRLHVDACAGDKLQDLTLGDGMSDMQREMVFHPPIGTVDTHHESERSCPGVFLEQKNMIACPLK